MREVSASEYIVLVYSNSYFGAYLKIDRKNRSGNIDKLNNFRVTCYFIRVLIGLKS